MNRPTILDVARLAGVSSATVSRALTGTDTVSEKVRLQVLSAAETLGYTGNSIARALRRDKTGTIGMIIPDLSNPFFTLLVEDVERGLQGLGLSLFLCSSRGDVAIEASRLRTLQSSQVDAILISPCHEFDSAAELSRASKAVPIVQIDQYADGVDTDWVGLDEHIAMRLIADHLAERGARTAVYVGPTATDSSARIRLDAVRQECARQGIRLDPEDILLDEFSAEWGERAARMLSARETLPDVIICGADIIALGVFQAFDALGISVPDEVMVTGFDDIVYSAHSRLSLTTIKQPIAQIAQIAVEMVKRITGPGALPSAEKVALPPTLIVRRSTARTI